MKVQSSRNSSPLQVTVICIAGSSGRFLCETVGSVLAQDYQDYELLLIDDETDHSRTVRARGYSLQWPDRVSCLRHAHQSPGARSAARNLALAQARGEYVAFVDADDRWQPRKLREQVALMEAYKEVGMVAGAITHRCCQEERLGDPVPTGHLIDAIAPAPEAALAVYPLGRAAPPCLSDVMIRRSVLEKVGCFEPSLAGPFEDSACFGKLLLAAPAYFSSRSWTECRNHKPSCMASIVGGSHYSAERAAFLQWYAGYLQRCAAPRRKAVLSSVRHAQWADLCSPAYFAVGRRLGILQEWWRSR